MDILYHSSVIQFNCIVYLTLISFQLQSKSFSRGATTHIRNRECNSSKIPFGEKCSSGWEFLTVDGWVLDPTAMLKYQG